MKKIFRAITVAAATTIAAVSMLAMVGCDTKYPEVTITYEFNGKKYEVEYMLTRNGAPQTVRHFIELADAGYYDGTVIHDYNNNGLYLYGGGYVLDENGELEEKDYWTEVKKLENEGANFTQTVFMEGDKTPLYTVRGEFSANGVKKNNKSYYHNQAGTLVMYYMDKGSDTTRVGTVRSDGGENNDGEDYQEGDYYKYNSATSLFYTFTSTGGAKTELDDTYCAFGRTKDFEQLQKLLNAVSDVMSERDEENPFLVKQDIILNQHDPFDLIRNGKISATYSVPDIPITIVSVKVNKY